MPTDQEVSALNTLPAAVAQIIGNRYRTERAAMEAVSAYLRKGGLL